MRILLMMALVIISLASMAQFSNARLQAGGLTCPMCSKAVKGALEEVSFVDNVSVNLNTLEYELTFKKEELVDFDKLKRAVEDAGFSIVSFKATANFDDLWVGSDGLLQLDNQTFYVINQSDIVLNGVRTITVVDKSFMTVKAFKKYSAAIGKRKDSARKVYHIVM